VASGKNTFPVRSIYFPCNNFVPVCNLKISIVELKKSWRISLASKCFFRRAGMELKEFLMSRNSDSSSF
jgi:hypothetical protein